MRQAARLLAEISQKIGYKDKHALYSKQASELYDQLESYWSEEYGVYCDYATQSPSEADLMEVRNKGVGRVKLRLGLECHPGYVGIFPLLLQLLPADSHHLGRMLDVLGDPEQLWSPFGIRSLSAKDSYFGVGENYWRGAIWINCNFLALKVCFIFARSGCSPRPVCSALQALRHYEVLPGPYQQRARELHLALRDNVLATVEAQYEATGFLWENYDSVTGRGRGTHPFTGWTSLIVLVLADSY